MCDSKCSLETGSPVRWHLRIDGIGVCLGPSYSAIERFWCKSIHCVLLEGGSV